MLRHKLSSCGEEEPPMLFAMQVKCNVGRASLLSRQSSRGGFMDAFTGMLAV
jgi:hypothetical protein